MADGVDVIIPIFNEVACVAPLVARLRAAVPEARLLFVDNGSTDGTLETLAAQPDIRVLRHATNLGYGRSITDGLAAGSGERIVIIDADLEYHPEDVPAMLAALDHTPVVYASRLLDPARHGHALPATRALGNRAVTGLFNLLFGQHLTDLYTGLRAFRRDALPVVPLVRPGFDLVLELSVRFAQAGVRIGEVPAQYTPRATGHSKMRHVRELGYFAACLARLWWMGPPRPLG